MNNHQSKLNEEEHMFIKVRPRFFDQVGHQTTNASIGSTFSLYNVMVRLTKIMNRADKNWAYF